MNVPLVQMQNAVLKISEDRVKSRMVWVGFGWVVFLFLFNLEFCVAFLRIIMLTQLLSGVYFAFM